MSVDWRTLERALEWHNDQAMRGATDAECDWHLARARRAQRQLDALLSLCHHCHGTGCVWDGSGICANTQSSRRCPVCDGKR